MPAPSSSPIRPVLVHLAAAADTGRFAGTGVVAALAKVPDPRARRGVRHQIGAILVLAACAVLAGCRSFTAIGEWVANAYDQILAALEVGGCRPCESTIRRTLQRLDGDELDTAIGGWAAVGTQPPAGRRVVALDGKTVRGSASDTAEARHLLAAIDHRTAVVLGQVDVARKTNEIPMFPVLCDRLDDLTDAVITADALHAQRGHADYLVLQRRAHYLLTVKGNQPSLLTQLKALPWKNVPPAHTSTTRAHGRVEQRRVKVVTVATGIVFPHARQAIQITHKTRRLKKQQVDHRSRIRGHQPDHRASHRYRTRHLDPRPLGHRKPPAQGPRRHLRRRPLPGPHPHRTPRHGLAPQPGPQHPANTRRHQHRPSPPTSRMGPAPTHRTTTDQLKGDFAGAVSPHPPSLGRSG
jgi:predicted transposase YbfD/YdcC